MRLLKSTTTLLIFFILGVLFSNTLKAQSDTASTIALSNELIKKELGFYDLSFYLIDEEIRKKPQDKNRLLVQKAQIYFTMGKTKEGQAIINSIASNSNAYAFSRLVLGIEAVNRGNNKMAVKPLEEYFTFMKSYMAKNKPPANPKAIKDEFLKAVGYLCHAYTKLGKPTNRVTANGYVERLKKWINPDGDGRQLNEQQGKYEQILLAAQAKLDAAENMIVEGKKGWESMVNSTLKPLESIYWSGATSWTAVASIERARALCLLKRYDEASKELKKYSSLIRNLDVGYKKERMFYIAPSAKMYLWRGSILLGLAEKATNNDQKIKLYFSAAKSFLRVILKYDMNRCPYTGKSFSGFNKAKEALATLGKVINLPSGIQPPGGSFDRKRADEMFSRDKFTACIPLYMELIQAPGGRTSKDTPDFLYRVSISYLKTGAILEAMTLAGYLGDYFPNDKQFTPNTLLLVGEHFWKQYDNKTAKADVKKDALENALIMYEIYLKNCPTDKYASSISARVAKVYYDQATDMARKASKMPNSQAKLDKTNEAREAFKNAIPIYEHIVKNYGPTKMGKSSAYLLAWCYTNSRQFVAGAKLFLKFAELETKWEKPEQRNMGQVADAKLRAAENYVQKAVRLEKAAKKMRIKAENAPKATVKPDASEKTKKKGASDTEKTKKKKAPETEESLLAAAAENDKKAKGFFMEAVTNLDELLNKWMQPGGRLANVKKAKAKTKIKTVKEKAVALLGWAYDGAREQDSAIKAFIEYIKQYPESKGIPQAMLRLGMLYLEQDKPNEAAQVLNSLSAKYPEDGKKALPKLARAMYEIKKYDKSIDAVAKIFATGAADVAVADLRWIAKNMIDCGGAHPKAGALLAQKACKMLEELIKKPVLPDWVGKTKAKILVLPENKKKLQRTIAILKEQLLFMSASASYWAEDYQTAIESLDTLLANENTPYFWSGHFLRGAAYMGFKKPKKALDEDYAEISRAFLSIKEGKESLYFKVQCKIGDAYIALKEYGKAVAAYNNAVMSIMDTGGGEDDIPKKEAPPAEKKAQMEWVEYAVYTAACCQKKLGKTKEVKVLQDLYKKAFTNGKYKDKINSLPAPEGANKE